jgi:hypothetical protein
MKRLLLLLLPLLHLSALSTVQAQSLEAIFRSQVGKNMMMAMPSNPNNVEVQGHPYAHNLWAKGSFRTALNNEYTDVDLKFDAYSNALMILYRNDSMLVKPDVVREFDYAIGTQRYQFRNGFETILPEVTADTYLMVISEGRWSVYKDVKKVYKKSNFDPTYHTGNRFDWYEESHRYFVKSPDGEWSQLRVNRRNLTRLFGDKGREVDQYIRQRRMDIENDAHLSHIFEYASGLE